MMKTTLTITALAGVTVAALLEVRLDAKGDSSEQAAVTDSRSSYGSGSAMREADDWPLSRYDARRGAVSPHQLADELSLHWVCELPEPRRAWPWQMDEFEKMAFDASYDPVVSGGLMYVASMVTDSVTAYDIDSGQERWRYVTDGPVRLAPVVASGKVYAGSDDGTLHCIDATSGERIWAFQAGANNRMVLGNRRLISMWAVRGGPVIQDGTVYFAAGFWPNEGVFVYALDAETAEVRWMNSGSSSDLIEDSKGYFSFGGVAPQGQLAVVGDRLIVPGGRTVPAVYDRHTGRLLYFHVAGRATGKAAGGHRVFAYGEWYFNERDREVTYMYNVQDGAQYGSVSIDLASEEAFLGVRGENDRIYAYAADVQPTDKKQEPRLLVDRRGRPVSESRMDASSRSSTITGRLRSGTISDQYDLKELWTTEVEGIRRLHLQAGSTLYGSGVEGEVFALNLDDVNRPPRLLWTKRIEGEVYTMLAARDRLFVVTEEGRIYCFGPGERETVTHRHNPQPLETAGDAWAGRAEQLLEQTDVRGGYALTFGIGSGRLLEEVLRQSELRVIAFDPDPEKVAAMRDRFFASGLYGSRVTVHEGDATSLRLPPYIASLIVSEDFAAAGLEQGAEFARSLFHPLRPYGGIAWLAAADERQRAAFAAAVEAAGLEKHELAEGDEHVQLTRPGPLPGSATWTHQYADAGNSGVAADQRVKAPLGIAWFGSEPNHKTLPRHMHGPIPQVVEGRLILLGPHHISARCVYTGIELWSVEMPEVGANFTDFDFEARQAPLYFPNHPGANFIGAPYVSTPDSVYVIYDEKCLRLDAATGERLAAFELPDWEALQQQSRDPVTEQILRSYAARLQEGDPIRWGPVRHAGDYLIAAAYPHMFDDQQPGREKNWNATSSEFVVVMDRHTGEIRWVRQARYGFRHNAIAVGSGKVFVIDNISEEIRKVLDRRGIEPDVTPQVIALDLRTGELAWTYGDDVFGTSLSYSESRDVLVQSGHPGRRRPLEDEPQDRICVLRGEDGELLWAESYRQRRSPLGLHDSWGQILGSSDEGAMDMLTGERRMHRHPMTDEPVSWTWTGALRCGTQNFSEHLATFRSGAAAFADLSTMTTANITGVRAGCTNNLVVADGMFNAPDYTRSCSCSYQHQTSLGLVHVPEAEMWTFSPFGDPKPFRPGFNIDEESKTKGIRRVGINFGAPGSRVDPESNVLWIEYPPMVGPAPQPPVTIQTEDEPVWFHQHSSIMEPSDAGHAWVAASGVQGLRGLSLEGLVTGNDGSEGPTYSVRLHFAEPEPLQPGQRVFDILLQGRTVREGFDIIAAAGDSRRIVVAEFDGISPDGQGRISVRFDTKAGSRPPLLCGIEVRIEALK